VAGRQGPYRRDFNSTDYVHPNEENLNNLHRAMEYNAAGEPVIRTAVDGDITIGEITVDNVEISNDIGNPIPVSSNTTANSSSNPIHVTGVTAQGFEPTQLDAFGRLRISDPVTLFDSFHRYADNGKIGTETTGTASAIHNSDQGLIECDIGTALGDSVKRESTKVFSYQPGKSLLILQTFVMNSAKTGLRQRYGYFNSDNGLFFEQENNTYSFVKRSSVSGTVTDTKITQNNWNVDTMDGTGPSGITLDFSKAQILFTDVEWLGVGSVRMGFIVDGVYYICHIFHHANIIDSTYMTTACLPVRAEIENIAGTASASKLKIICASVISEGGYELKGKPFSVGHSIANEYSIATSGVLYPLLSVRLKSSQLDAIVLPKRFSLAVTGNTNYQFKLIKGGITTGGTWQSAGTDSAVEYNLSSTSITGGQTLETGYIINSNQGSILPNLQETPFVYQLERNSFTGDRFEFTVCLETTGTNEDAWCAIDWDEIT